MISYISDFWVKHNESILFILNKVFFVLIIGVIALIFSRVLVRAIRKIDTKYDSFDSTLVPVLVTISRTGISLIALIFILESLGVKATSLVALIGAAGLAIGLALKDTLSHIAAGIMILILRPFKAGHFIECSSVSGTIKEIGLFSTTLETPDGLYVMAPNSSLWGSPIKNITRNGKRRMDLVVGISYDDSIDTGFDVLRELARKESRFLEDPAPQVMVQSIGDSSIVIQLRAWTTIDNYWKTYWDNNKLVKEEIEAAGLTIPFPQIDIHGEK